MKLDYSVQAKKRPQVDTRTALSMQATLESAIGNRTPHGAGGQMPPTTKADGFGRSV